ncbi:MAG TPA: PxKF domain-containing protein, partial [Polyangia bacterium]|nr:PxKF domain-containing protein [Polyangia bacterium]
GTAGSVAMDTDGTLLVSGVDDGNGVPGFFLSRYDTSGAVLGHVAWTHGTPAFTEGGTSEVAMVLSGGKTVLAGHSALVGDISFVGQPWIETTVNAVDAAGTWRSDTLQPYAPAFTVGNPATLTAAPPFGVGVTNFGGGSADLFLSVTGLGAIAAACVDGDDCASGFCVHGVCSRLCAYNPGPMFSSGFAPVTCAALSSGSQVTLLTSPLLPNGAGRVTVGFETAFTGEVAASGGIGCPAPGGFILDPPGATVNGLPHYWNVAVDPTPNGDTEVCLTYDQAWFGPESAAEASLQILHSFSSPLVSGVCDPVSAGWTALTPSRPVDTTNNIVCGTAQTFVLLLPGGASAAPIGARCTTPSDCVPEAFCIDGVCCESACGDGDGDDNDCQVCSADKGASVDGACTLLGSTHKCRESNDPVCDLGGFCAGGPDCPANTPAPSATTCYTRPTNDQCFSREETITCGGNLTCAEHTDWQDQGCVTQDPGTFQFTLSDGANPPATITVQFTEPWPGTISVKRATGCPPATGFTFPPSIDPAANYWDLDAQPALDGTFDVEVCITYPQSWFGGTDPAEVAPMESSLQLRHGNSNAQITPTTCNPDLAGWAYLPTTSLNPKTNRICANTSSLSPFALMIPSGVDQLPTMQLPGLISAPATSAAGAVVTYTATATDTKDGPLVPTCLPASGSKFPLGQTTVTCKVIDSDHLATEGTFTVWVQVQAPTDGTFFLPPINPDASSIFKGGTIPVKFKLTGASALITDLTAHLLVAKISGGVSGTELEAASTSAADSGNVFRYDPASRQYIFNLSAKSMPTGTWSLRADLGDAVTHQVNVSIKGTR